MQKNTLLIGFVAVLIGLGAGYLLANSSSYRYGMGAMMGRGAQSQDLDQRFIIAMIPHHEGAIAMAKVALERSKRPEIISLANGIISAQQKEIDDMRSWYQSWYGSAPPASVSGRSGMGMVGGMHMDGMTGDMDELATVADADFDREFIDQMIPHHEMAIMMVQMMLGGTERAEMKQLADNIVTSQSREIEMMRSWKASWYGGQ